MPMRVHLSLMRGTSSRTPGLVILLLACLLACGCIQAPGPRDTVTPVHPASPPPIVGSWLSLPHDPDGIQDLYLFKESGRCDATVVPAAGIPPTYEVHLQGRWEETPKNRYLLAGEEITHHFVNDSHSTTTVRDLLLYDPGSDRLIRDSDPAHPLERISSEATIPPGMNVSIPWD
jgi:hypothetical protein